MSTYLRLIVCLSLALLIGGWTHGSVSLVVTDDFNRANGALGANWVDSPTLTGLTIVSNAANSAGASWKWAYWKPSTNTFNNDQSSQITLTSVGAGTFGGPVVRHQTNGTSSGYFGFVNAGTSQAFIYRSDSGTFTQLNLVPSVTVNIGDTIALNATGSTLTLSVNGVTKVTTTDATYTSGQPGIAVNNTSVDNFLAGPIASSGGGGGDVAFALPTGRNLFFISTTGSDAANGLTPATAWASPNHAVNCGDVILVQPGTYTSGWGLTSWGTVSSCPSSSGGIDGAGGIYFAILLCAGADVMSCQINTPALDPIRPTKGNWAIEGFWASNGPGPTHGGTDEQTGCFMGDNQSNPTLHYLAFINNIASNCNTGGFITGGGGCTPATTGCSFDQIAIVGAIAFNAANSNTGVTPHRICGSGISPFPGNPDSSPGTHLYFSQYFGAYNTNSGTANGSECDATFSNPVAHPRTDGEGFLFDTYASAYATPGAWNKPAVFENGVIWHSGNDCVQSFPQGNGTTNEQGQYYVFNVTCYANNQDARARCAGEMSFNGIYPTGTALYKVNNNIFLNTLTSCGGAGQGADGFGNIDAALNLTGNVAHVVVLDDTKIDISNNWIWQSAGTTTTVVGPPNTNVVDNLPSGSAGVCTPPFSPPCFNAPWHFGTNTYNNPGLTSPITLFSTTPNCAGFDNVVLCMNVGFGVYAKVTPTIAPLTMGYQPPGPCLSNTSDPQYLRYPSWLKGIVYLRPSGFTAGATITRKAGLVTMPCGL